jgi:DNA-binding MarR family transcriptional regulator
VATEAELAFADKVGRFFARQYGMPPATGKVIGWMLICDPPGQTAAEIADALQMGRSAVGTAVAQLERLSIARRTCPPGERADRIVVDPSFGAESMENPAEYAAQAALARDGLEVLRDAPLERRARLLELAAFGDTAVRRRVDRTPRIPTCLRRTPVTPAIHAEGVRQAFGEVVALDGLDLTVEPGTVFGRARGRGARAFLADAVFTG